MLAGIYLKIAGAVALVLVVLAIFGVGHHIGDSSGFTRGYGEGDTAGQKSANAVAKAKFDQQKIDAQAQLDGRIEENRLLKKSFDHADQQRKEEHEQQTKSLDALYARNRLLAGDLGRLRDPFAQPGPIARCSGDGTGSPGSSGSGVDPGVPAEAPGLLSERLTRFLFDQFRDADGDAQTAAECRAFVLEHHPASVAIDGDVRRDAPGSDSK